MLACLVGLSLAAPPTAPARPPDDHAVATPVPTGGRPAPVLTQVSATRNQITDVDAWFVSNGLALPRVEPAPAWAPPSVGGLPRLEVIAAGGGVTVALYGTGYAASRLLAFGPDGRSLADWDLASWLPATRSAPGDEAFTGASVRWAAAVEGVLYLSVAHSTYAKSSMGKNAWITAVDLATGAWRWQSDPLVCNASEFVVLGDHLVCGYGFTAEPDAVTVLDRGTGATVAKVKVKSGPEHLVLKDGRLYVRTYDTDYVFSVR